MKLQAELNNEQYEVTIKQKGEKVFAKVNGREYELEAGKPEPNIYLIKADNKIFEIFVSPNDDRDKPFQVKVKDIEFDINIFDPKRLRGLGGNAGITDGIVEIKTAMPGKLVRILVEEGSEIKSGEGVLVVEAMKMQNEMKSPKDGIVKEIRFDEGATVNAGEILAVIE